MKIGLKTRFSDLDTILALKPAVVEFQFSDQDADYNFRPKNKCDIPAIIHLPEFWHGHLIDLAGIKQENQVLPLEESRAVIAQIVAKSERFFQYFNNEKNTFILHPGGMSYEKDLLQNNTHRMETLITSLSRIKLVNSEILVENLPPLPWYFGGQWNSNIFMDASEIDQFCLQTKRKICYDISHSKLYCNFTGNDFIKQFELFKKNMVHLHIADAQGTDGEGIQIDEGEVDFQEVFRRLRNFEGFIVPEVWMGYSNDFLGFKIAMKKIAKYLS